MKEKLNLLIDILLDKKARVDERDDAAIDLGRYNVKQGLFALIKVATDPSEEPFIFDSCGESIARIWVKYNLFDHTLYNKMVSPAKHEIFSYIRKNKSEWIEKYHLEIPKSLP